MFACFKGKGCIRWLAIALDAFEEEKTELSKHLLLLPWGNELLVELIRIGEHNYELCLERNKWAVGIYRARFGQEAESLL